jgi:hypothetical protein
MSDELFQVEPEAKDDPGYGDPQDMSLEALPRLETEEALWLE